MSPIKRLPPANLPTSAHKPVYGAARSEAGSPQVQRTRARLMDAGVRVFGQLGRAASINDIVQAAGISRPSYYNYYPSVDALFESISAELLADMNLRVDRSFDAVADPAARISIGIRHFCRRAHEDADWANFLLNFALVDPAITDHARSTLLRDIAAGVKSGRWIPGSGSRPRTRRAFLSRSLPPRATRAERAWACRSHMVSLHHGGQIDVESQPGKGSKFTVWLPL